MGRIAPQVPDGGLTPASNLPAPATQVAVTIGNQPAQIVYQGSAPGAVYGLYQINCVIPAGVPTGNAAVVVSSAGRLSMANLTVAVK